MSNSETPSATARAHAPIGEWLIALGVLGLAGVIYWQAASIPVSPIFSRIGPTVVPYLLSLAMALLGIFLVIAAARGGWQPEEEQEVASDRIALGWVALGLLLNVSLIGTLGFTLASILMFVCIARGFGSRKLLRDATIAALFALIAYFGFAKALGINIGSGLLENAIESVLPGKKTP